MKINSDNLKYLVLLIVFFLFGLGRWINLAIVHDWSGDTAFLLGIIYGTMAGLLAYFLTDLVLTKGLLQHKIIFIKTILFIILFVTLVNCFISWRYWESMADIAIIETILLSVFFIVALNIDGKKKTNDAPIFIEAKPLPGKYLNRHPLKTLLEMLLRLFPYPEPPALYKIGNPSAKSPVLVTGNYELTIRRVAAAIKSLDCWLLVCDSRGVNVWCSSTAGLFKTADVTAAIKATGLTTKVDHKEIILPQLCAAAVFPQQIYDETGFTARFGPVSCNHIPGYLADPKNKDIRKATFTIEERLEMAVGCPLIYIACLVFIYNFIDLSNLSVIIPIIYGLTILHAVIFPGRMIKSIVPWSLFVGGVVFFIIYGLFSAGMSLISPGNSLAIGLGMIYIVNEFSGWSPLQKYSLSANKKASIAVDPGLCTGCYLCIEVCPKAVFDFQDGKAIAAREAECVLCKSCFRQCPVGAITHSFQ
ncbi:MAG: 4Fe-4S binding protein [Candidatus Aminicenantes bacterium]|nr:4Fe-4S binding protein [Candidatus Aminicenantes bacterium]